MSVSIDQSRYFMPGYLERLAATDAVAGAAAPVTEGTEDAAASESENVAAPLISGTQLLSSNDLRLLLLRDVRGEDLEGYKQILEAFNADPANRDDPVGFLENLSGDGIDLLVKAQSLPEGTTVDIRSLNQEEALNFILPQSGKVDLNDDGIVAGANNGKMFMFPPPNAPQEVKDAWNAATETMSERDIMMLSGKFMTMHFLANIHVDENGRVTQTEVDESGYRNVFAEEGFSYQDAIRQMHQSNEFGRYMNKPEIYERTKELLNMLGAAFTEYGVA